MYPVNVVTVLKYHWSLLYLDRANGNSHLKRRLRVCFHVLPRNATGIPLVGSEIK